MRSAPPGSSRSTGTRGPARRRSSWRTRRCSRRGLGCTDGSTRRGRTSAPSGASRRPRRNGSRRIASPRSCSPAPGSSRPRPGRRSPASRRRPRSTSTSPPPARSGIGDRRRRWLAKRTNGTSSADRSGGSARSSRSSPSPRSSRARLTVFATGQQREAQAQERNATARELAAASVANLEVDPERSILLALEAIDVTRSADGTVLPEAEEALHRAVIASRIVLTEEDLGGTLDWSPAGVFVTEGPENTGTIDLRDATTGESVRSWVGHEDSDVNDVQFSTDGSMLATAGDDGFLKIWDPDTGEEIASVRGTTGAWGQSFDADGRLVAAAWPEDGVGPSGRGRYRRRSCARSTAWTRSWSTRPSARTGAGWPSRARTWTSRRCSTSGPATSSSSSRGTRTPCTPSRGARTGDGSPRRRPTHPCASGTRRPARSRSGWSDTPAS